jgi:diguanylate cyclase (GGDEF)-like protein
MLLAAAVSPAAIAAGGHGPHGNGSGQRGAPGQAGPRTHGPAQAPGRAGAGHTRRERSKAPPPSHDARPDRGAHRRPTDAGTTGGHHRRGHNAAGRPGRKAAGASAGKIGAGGGGRGAAATPVVTAPIPVSPGAVVPARPNVPSTVPTATALPRLGPGVEDALASAGALSDARIGRGGVAGVSPVSAGTLSALAAAPALAAGDGFAALAAPITPAHPGTPAGGTRSRVPTVLGDALAAVPTAVWVLLAALGGLALLFAATTTVATIASHRRGRALSQVEARAVTDSLTGLLVRGALEGRLAAEVGRARRHNRQVSVVFFDVRGLKRINDVHGHGAGDRLLREVGALLNTTSRDHDVCGRVGGDECVVVLPEDDGAGADAFRRRVYAALPQARANVGLATDWDLTSGVATFPRDGLTPGDLLATADRRLYHDRGIEIDPPASSAR